MSQFNSRNDISQIKNVKSNSRVSESGHTEPFNDAHAHYFLSQAAQSETDDNVSRRVSKTPANNSQVNKSHDRIQYNVNLGVQHHNHNTMHSEFQYMIGLMKDIKIEIKDYKNQVEKVLEK